MERNLLLVIYKFLGRAQARKPSFFYVSKVKEVITETVRTLAPYDKRNLLQATLNSLEAGEINDETLSVSSDIFMAVVESYNTLSEPGERRQLPSIIADIIPFKRLQELIPEISRHQVTQAKKHNDQFGRGAAVPVSAGLPRERVDSGKVDHFLDLALSRAVISFKIFHLGPRTLSWTVEKQLKFQMLSG